MKRRIDMQLSLLAPTFLALVLTYNSDSFLAFQSALPAQTELRESTTH